MSGYSHVEGYVTRGQWKKGLSHPEKNVRKQRAYKRKGQCDEGVEGLGTLVTGPGYMEEGAGG